ncbi:hypothetical protein BO99DRAFT_334285 [Aspergillus violaceofuscus CBS 115571]|uniref:Arrestin-like N-terminal domain-containing protein n=1 Tax=Aspergillus violaceofuscus (strain CBS 115571) TaxID=1450538 RepID=A0A2V5H4A2_ASPV1|nr:hypothetical protein BO99DRAFT_334285 [Aspergillus violaceofuscus CBS 115571]
MGESGEHTVIKEYNLTYLRPRDGNSTKSCQGGITFARSQTLATSRDKSFVLPRGMYVLPFELPLSQDMPETVTGVGHKYHAYEVQSIIFHRHSHLDTMSAHPIRLYRLPRVVHTISVHTDGRQSLKSVDGLINESLWYRVSMHSAQILFGTSFPVRFEFHSLQKHLYPGKIILRILETHLLKITSTASDSITYNSVLSAIARKEHAILCETHENLRYTNAQSPDLLDSEWETTAHVHLPQFFYACTQDLHTELIRCIISCSLKSSLRPSVLKEKEM